MPGTAPSVTTSETRFHTYLSWPQLLLQQELETVTLRIGISAILQRDCFKAVPRAFRRVPTYEVCFVHLFIPGRIYINHGLRYTTLQITKTNRGFEPIHQLPIPTKIQPLITCRFGEKISWCHILNSQLCDCRCRNDWISFSTGRKIGQLKNPSQILAVNAYIPRHSDISFTIKLIPPISAATTSRFRAATIIERSRLKECNAASRTDRRIDSFGSRSPPPSFSTYVTTRNREKY